MTNNTLKGIASCLISIGMFCILIALFDLTATMVAGMVIILIGIVAYLISHCLDCKQYKKEHNTSKETF